ncbi:hypothetical protein PC113_g20178 [Phytophthora cactorum]|uniref:Uncharacterized protein n=1 Tax=Phytophthora cactorum TaxID=29920 RepID=A0A8T0YB62_9STRA|nr:hypothetical protein PC113_g20178 [Phytophthora cactorum]KAG2900118.1 hypothetical protein PC117_g22057 [Phytophthora cactorum]
MAPQSSAEWMVIVAAAEIALKAHTTAKMMLQCGYYRSPGPGRTSGDALLLKLVGDPSWPVQSAQQSTHPFAGQFSIVARNDETRFRGRLKRRESVWVGIDT